MAIATSRSLILKNTKWSPSGRSRMARCHIPRAWTLPIIDYLLVAESNQALDSVGGADDIYYDAATGRIYFTGSTGTVAVFKEIDPDHFQLLGKVPTGAVSKTGLWVPELKRFYSAVPQHFVLTVPHGTKDFRADLLKELNLKEGEVAPILSNMIVEEAHLMVFDYLP